MSDSDFDSGESELSENFSDPETSDSERGPRPTAELHGSPSKKKQEKISAGARQEKQQQPSLNKDRRKKREKLKIGEEVRALTDLESDVATLQIKEILKEITLKEKKRQALLAWFSQIKALLLAAGQDSGKKHQPKRKRLQESAVSIQQTPVPIPIEGCFAPEPQLVEEFVFQPPKSVRLVGSFAYGTAVKWSTLDVSVEMPKECFAKGDYHNLKYHHKRAVYLTHLAAAFQKSSAPQLYSKLQWRVNGDYRLPELVVTSGDGSFSARILPFPEEGFFQNSRFAPDKLNIQEKFIGMPPESRKPVPIYNGGVLQDMLLPSTAEKLSKQLSSSSGVREGIQVLKLWLRTRGLSEGPDGFSSFLLTIYASHLLKTDRLNSMMGAYQVVRAVLAQIQADDWTAATTTTSNSVSSFDESGCHNYFYRLSSSGRSLLKEEARAALHTVNSGSLTLINELFSTKISFYRKLDCYAKISLGNAASQKEQGPAKRLDEWTRADYGGGTLWPCTEAVLATLRRAFGRRVSLLASKSLESAQWDIGCRIPQEPQELEIGWNLNPDETHHIDKGPPADSSEAEEFRSFWGEKCEIRRFQDGSILETVVWPDDDDHKKVVQHICDYILLRQHDISRISFAGELCDRVLELPKCHFSQRYGIGQDQLFDINTKFNEFARMLRSLKDLPLSITTVQGLSDEIAYTSVFPQAAASCDTDARLITRVDGRCVPKPAADQGVPKLVKPVDILLVMESSSKWPDELGAIRHIKTAFYLALATKLEGRECQVFPEHLLVLFQGLVFRLQISCPKEILLARQEVTPEGMVRLHENKISQRLEFEHTVLPQLISALHGLQLQHPTFGTTCRIAKRWLSCHLLYDAFPSLAVDLIVASLYLSPLPLSCAAPHSSRAAFQRFLHLMSTFDWRLNPLIVNINNQFSQEDIQQINSNFTRQRQSLPPMYIQTPFDRTSNTSSFVTSEKPMGLALNRAAKLAGKCLAVLELKMAAGQGVLGIFRTSLEVFDFVIKLDPRFVATSYLALDSQEKLSFTKIRDEIPVVDFDPVSIYVSELRAAFGHLCVLFYDGFGGTVIGGLWIPKAQVPLPFKVRNVNARKLIEPAKVLVPNYSAIFTDFKTLGLGLVKEVVEQRCPNNYNSDSRMSTHLGPHAR